MEEVILVDENGRQTGTGEKIKTHKEGKLHRAISVFVLNSNGELLIQKRAKNKYHSGGLWTNTCCSHPRPDESTKDAAMRRLKEEMGFSCKLKEAFSFTYRIKFDNGLSEHEYDHVFIGRFDGQPKPSPKEVEEWKWMDPEELRKDIAEHPENYTYWLKAVIDRFISYAKKA